MKNAEKLQNFRYKKRKTTNLYDVKSKKNISKLYTQMVGNDKIGEKMTTSKMYFSALRSLTTK